MSVNLWRYYLENDVDKFRQFLAEANYASHGSPSAIATSPRTPLKSRKSSDVKGVGSHGKGPPAAGRVLTRADINSKDSHGCTILHHAATSVDEDAYAFVQALVDVPYIDLYVQDLESGWTPLHRALYFGNISAAQAIMLRDVRDATDFTSGMAHTHLGGLIKIKDHEGNSPFEVFGLTVASRDLHRETQAIAGGPGGDDSSSVDESNIENEDDGGRSRSIRPRINLRGDELYTFGSNKNLTLALGDEDDRQFPERPPFDRPMHLLRSLQQEYLEKQARHYEAQELSTSQVLTPPQDDLPAVIKYQPLVIQDVTMSKLSTAVLTDDPEANLFMSGFGPGGRLGTGDETTRFKLVCIDSGGLAGKKIATVALGQDHTIAISDRGEVFTWGSNKYGQLGYSLPAPSVGQDIPIQLVPRQLFGSTKREVIVGAAASATHSAIITSSALYTFGKNDGQLGLMDADARSLEIQTSPRRVGVNVLQSSIHSVAAIDQATIVLLDNHDVIVFTHYGWTKVVFPLESFDHRVISGTIPSQRFTANASNHITKVTSGGNTICALSAFGEVFTVDVIQRGDARSIGTSTTHPIKAKNALPIPTRVWSIRKSHMAARDVAVGQHGSIILCTESGSVWRKEKRANLKEAKKTTSRAKDYKFVRVPTLTRVVAVRSNAFGAFAAVRKDTQVTKEQIDVDPQTLWGDLLPLLPFRNFTITEDSDEENPQPRFWTPYPSGNTPSTIKQALILSKDAESDIQHVLQRHEPLSDSSYDMWVVSNVTKVRIPAHSFIFGARSSILRHAFGEFQHSYFFNIPDAVSIEYGKDGQMQMLFYGADFYTLVNVVFYAYCENVVDIWHHTRRSPASAARFRQIRREVMDIAAKLEMKGLERAARLQVDPSKRLHLDMELAFADEQFFVDGDIAIQLANDTEIKAHSALVCLRCPFFEGMFHGRAAGKWIASRRDTANDAAEPVTVDLKHVDPDIFTLVLRHIYADTGEELFDEVLSQDLDGFLDVILDVMSVANELMLDRLAQISQKVLGRYVNIRNVCHLLNAVAPCTVDEIKKVCLEYICLNLEVMLENRLLEELDEDLLCELDAVVQDNQIEHSLIARSGKAEEELLERHPELIEKMDIAKQRKIDSMRLSSRLHQDEERSAAINKLRVGSVDKSLSLVHRPNSRGKQESVSPAPTPALHPKASANDLLFDMDEEGPSEGSASPQVEPDLPSPSIRPRDLDMTTPTGTPKENEWTEVKARSMSRSIATTLSSANGSYIFQSRQIDDDSSKVASRPLSTTTGFAKPAKPWSMAPAVDKTDLTDIIAQASANKVSNLSLAIGSRTPESLKASFGAKMSQKERKKIVEQQRLERAEENKATRAPWTPGSQGSSKPNSPWQAVRAPSAPAVTDRIEASASTNTTQRSTNRPNMTLRQTISGGSSSASKQPPSTLSPSKPAPQPCRPPSSAIQQQLHQSTSRSTLPSNSTSAPQIQSIRHTPHSNHSQGFASSKTSLVDILNQQQFEKTAIVEARTAKRSLQEIQAEQEFQAWWDQESKKAVAEEALRRAEDNNKGRGTIGSRGGKKGGRGVVLDEDKHEIKDTSYTRNR
ncbi:putative btb domain and ankyrin repeat protein [Phaeomoniella chlamydospora]|uniref:Putative btb domain and ankyrin repeat protein n=1 Tax=Phaeomoniella chlamydospora TaxID=158046 RepID=A0A0G2DVD2_PHACM|nr:putative btb domain and ankyrin repeat protein [Phaeomoniella chlamydospora]